MNANFPIIDCHTDLVLAYQELKSQLLKNTESQISIPTLQKGQVKLLFGGFSYDDLLGGSMKQFEDMYKIVNDFPETFQIVNDFTQVNKLLHSEKIGIILHLEGGKIIGTDLNKLIELHRRGLKSLGLTHNTKNNIGTGAAINSTDGLTKFGKEVIKKCNELKIIIDLSHLNEKGFYESLEISKYPPIVSHGNSYFITPHPRNFKDSQLREIKKLGSIVGLFLSGKYLNPNMDGTKASINDAIKHIEHMVKIMGIDHVAIGSDFGGITTGLPKGLKNHKDLLTLFQKLMDKGYKKEDIEKIAFRNALRVLTMYS